jgi:hypothetical protein
VILRNENYTLKNKAIACPFFPTIKGVCIIKYYKIVSTQNKTNTISTSLAIFPPTNEGKKHYVTHAHKT